MFELVTIFCCWQFNVWQRENRRLFKLNISQWTVSGAVSDTAWHDMTHDMDDVWITVNWRLLAWTSSSRMSGFSIVALFDECSPLLGDSWWRLEKIDCLVRLIWSVLTSIIIILHSFRLFCFSWWIWFREFIVSCWRVMLGFTSQVSPDKSPSLDWFFWA